MVLGAFEAHETGEFPQDLKSVARGRFHQQISNGKRPRGVGTTRPVQGGIEEFACLASGFLGDLHGRKGFLGWKSGGEFLGGLFGEALLILGGENLAGNLGGGLDDESGHLALHLVDHAVALGGNFVTGALNDGGGFLHGFLHLALGEGLVVLAGFLEKHLRVVVGLAENLLVAELRLGELLLDLLGIELRFLDALAALVQNLQERPEGILAEDEVYDEEENQLGDEMRPIDSELLENLGEHLRVILLVRGLGKGKPRGASPYREAPSGRKGLLAALEGEDQTEDRDGLGQSDRQNADHENLGQGAGIAANGLDHAGSDEADADGGSGAGDAEGEAAGDSGRSDGLGEDGGDHMLGMVGLVLFFEPPSTSCMVPAFKSDEISVPRGW